MEKAARRILKSNDVRLEGRFRLDTRQPPQGPAGKKSDVASHEPAVHLVENNPEFAVVEVTCSCGAKTRIKCEYPDAQSVDQGPNQEDHGENDNES